VLHFVMQLEAEGSLAATLLRICYRQALEYSTTPAPKDITGGRAQRPAANQQSARAWALADSRSGGTTLAALRGAILGP
jgi:hypothetical protein